MKAYPSQAVPQVQSTLAKLSLCRTAALGGRRYRCADCDQTCVVYNSCGDRHCPTCRGSKRADWIDATSRLLLDGVDYFQVVFTLPKALSRLSLGNRKSIYNLLFQASWRALRKTIHSEQGYDAAAMMVLHTWNQRLDAHGHVHAVVPGAGPALDGSGWRRSQRAGDPSSVGKYLVDADALRTSYREQFLRGLDRLRRKGQLRLEGEFQELQSDAGWQAFMDELQSVTWVSYIEPPPTADCRAEQVVKYLGRYLTGGPISDARIVSADERAVTFLAREGTTTGGTREQVPVTLPLVEFVRRWSLHVLPKGFTKTRRYGGWSNTRRRAYQQQCRDLLSTSSAEATAGLSFCNTQEESLSADASEEIDLADAPCLPEAASVCCPCCGGAMILQRSTHKPSWRDVMSSAHRPAWYALPPPTTSLSPTASRQ